MTHATLLLGLGATGAATATGLSVWCTFFASPEQHGRQALRRYERSLQQHLRFLRIQWSLSRLLLAQCVSGLGVIVLAALSGAWLALLLLPVLIWGPRAQIERLVARRVTAVEAQIESWLNALANALKASASLGEAIESSVSLVPAPMSEEIQLLCKEYALGTSLDRALEQMAERVGSRTLNGAILALQVARNSGGNLPEMLENAASALRELARLEGVVRTKTAEGKAQSFVIGAIPVPMVAGLHLLDPHFFAPLVSTFTGNLIIGAAVGLWGLAILLASKILAVDV